MSPVSVNNLKMILSEKLQDRRILLVAPSLAIMGGQAVQADLLLRNFKQEGVEVGFLPHNPTPRGPLKYLTRIKYVRTLVVSFFYLISLLVRIRHYDIIHIFSASYFSFILAPTPALLVAKLYGKKTILNYRSGEAEDHLKRGGKLVASILKLADKIVVPSDYLVDVFAGFGFQAEAVYNISDVSQFRFQKRDEVVPKIIIARNLEPLYDIATSLRAFKIIKQHCPDAELSIVGDGSDRRRLIQLVDELGLDSVTFTGRVERDKIPKLFDQADIFVNSSVIDNMPVAIIEAFYAGLPVITTNAGGIPYVVCDRENGLLVEMRDHRALAQAVIEVIENIDLREKIITGGREDAKKYSWDNVKYKWASVYNSLVTSDG